MKLSFITFGGKAIGTGHLFRCLAIVDWVEKLNFDFDISFHLFDSVGEDQKIALEILQERSNYPCFIENEITIKKIKFDRVVFDLLNVPFELMKLVKNNSNFTVSIDNTSKSRDLCDISINPLYYTIEGKKNSHDYVGPNFQIISNKFFDRASIWKKKLERVVIIQGGSDPYEITPKIVRNLKSLAIQKKIELHVVIGPATKKSDFLIDYYNQCPQEIIIHNNIIEMSDFLLNIDLAICSIGIISFEIASMGIPAIHITGVEKELETAKSMSDLGVSIDLGIYGPSLEKINNIVKKMINNEPLRRRMRDNCLQHFNSSASKDLIELIVKGDSNEKHQVS